MIGPRQEAQAALFHEFSLEDHVPHDHLLRSIDRFVDLGNIRKHLADFYSHTGRPSVDPELLIRMLLVGYCFDNLQTRDLCGLALWNFLTRNRYLPRAARHAEKARRAATVVSPEIRRAGRASDALVMVKGLPG